MSVSVTQLCLWYLKGKEPIIFSGSSSDLIKLSCSKKKQAKLSSSVKKVKKKWQSREERKRVVEKEYDLVLVPSDGVCLSASEDSSYDSDWSIGWMEPHSPDFYTDTDLDTVADNSFAVLVPCYRNDCKTYKMEEIKEQQPSTSTSNSNQFSNVLTNFPNGFPAAPEGNKYMEKWLTSLQNI